MDKLEYKLKKKEIKKNINENKLKLKKIKVDYKKTKQNTNLIIENDKNQPPHLNTLEEIGNSITHGIGALFAILATILMIFKSKSSYQIAGALIYGISMFLMFSMSSLYHAFKYGLNVKKIFRIFDYSSIYLLIGGTFAPILLILLNNLLGLIILVCQWGIIIVGITMVAIFGPGRLKWLHFPAYFVLGWGAGMFILPTMVSKNIELLWWILAGGISYTLGMIPFCLKGKKVAHFIWHFIVIIGVVLHFIGIYYTLY